MVVVDLQANPTSASTGSGFVWNDPENVFEEDGEYSRALASSTSSPTAQLTVGGADFSVIPDSATIRGIQVGIKRRSSGAAVVRDSLVRFWRGGQFVGQDKASAEEWPADFEYQLYGGENDLWGTTWTVGQIESELELGIRAQRTGGLSDWVDIDHVYFVVYYTAAATKGEIHHFLDLETGAFWPIQYGNSEFDPTAVLSYDPLADEDKSDLLLGCGDGYVRQLDRSSNFDDGYVIESKVLIGPLLVGRSSIVVGLVESLDIATTRESGDVTVDLRVGPTFESVADDEDAAAERYTIPGGGLAKIKRPRRRGTMFSLVLSNAEGNDGWSVEQIGVVTTERGRRRK